MSYCPPLLPPHLTRACVTTEATPSGVPVHDVVRELNIPAAHVLMKIMYGARMARQDLLRASCVLARMLTKWDEQSDWRLLRVVSYINSTLGTASEDGL